MVLYLLSGLSPNQIMKKIMNGSSMTLELHNTVFRNPKNERKVSMLVKLFTDLSGHQLQINALNSDQLLDA